MEKDGKNNRRKVRFIFLGRWGLGVCVLSELLRLGEVIYVISSKRETDKPFSGDVWEMASRYGVRCIDFDKEDWRSHLHQTACDLLVTCSFPEILRNRDIDSAFFGGVNFHQSLLPKHRGPSPIPHAILNGDSEIGCTLHRLAEKVDAGNILAQFKMVLLQDDTMESIVERMKLTVPSILSIGIDLVLSRSPGIRQKDFQANYGKRISFPWDVSVKNLRKD